MKEKIKIVKTIHIALCLGVSVAYLFLGNLQSLDFLKIPELDSFVLIYLLLPLAAIFLGNLLYKQQLGNVDRKIPLEDKIGTYQTASLVRWAMLEGAAFFILIVKKELILMGIFLILYMFFLRPSEEAMAKDFKLYGK